MAEQSEWMPIGSIAGPFGVRGEIKIDLLTDFPERFRNLDTVYVGPFHLRHRVITSRRHQDRVLLTLEGIETPQRVAAMLGHELSVPRERAVTLPPGHYFLDDLIGAQVVTIAGDAVGEIREVLRTGSNDVFVVGAGRSELLIPSIKDAIRELDLDNRRVVVEPWVLESGD